MNLLFTFLGLFFFSLQAESVTTLKSVSSYIKLNNAATGSTGYVIYAGNTYNDCVGDGTLPCDSCVKAAAPIKGLAGNSTGLACNNGEIYPNLGFSVTISSDQKTSYESGCSSMILVMFGSTVIVPSAITTFTPDTANQDITATWTWGGICEKLGSSATCEASFSETVKIGFNKTCSNSTFSDGAIDLKIAFRYIGYGPPMSFGCDENALGAFEALCDFTLFPGDEKGYIKNSGANTVNSLIAGDQSASGPGYASTADASGVTYSQARFYYSKGSDFSILTTASQYKDIEMNVAGLQADSITGLQNGAQYVFLAASKDQAGNIIHFSDPTYAGNGLAMSALTTPLGETQSIIPEPVEGLLKDQRCFIATAAYGNSQDPQVSILRNFRDQYLLKSKWGQKFVQWYYLVSPEIANKIKTNPWLRAVTRVILWPIVGAAQLALWLPEAGAQTSSAGLDLGPEFDAEKSDKFQKPPGPAEGGVINVPHPLEKKGLIRINADGSYMYKTKKLIRTKSAQVLMGSLPSLQIGLNGQVETFYKSSTPFIVSFSDQSSKNIPFNFLPKQFEGRWGLGFGVLSGNGVLVNSQLPSMESYDLYIAPLTYDLIYKFEYSRTQLLAPFLGAGMGYLGLLEYRNDGNEVSPAGTFFLSALGGLQFSFMRLDPGALFVLQSEYDVTDVWVTIEARYMKSFKQDIDFSGVHVGAGVVLDF